MAHFGGDTLANVVLGWQYRCMAWDEGFSSQDHAQEVLYRGAEVSFYWQAHRKIPVNDKRKQLRSSVNAVVHEQLDFAIKDNTMFKAYIQEQVITVINKILRYNTGLGASPLLCF